MVRAAIVTVKQQRSGMERTGQNDHGMHMALMAVTG
jgi:hypothetical protein